MRADVGRTALDGADLLAEQVAAQFAARPEVVAVALAGSRTAGPALGVAPDPTADLDLYVYASDPIPVGVRKEIAHAFTGQDDGAEIDNRFWEPGDEFRDAATGFGVDLMYRTPEWIESELDRVLNRHEPSLGYTTCLWHNVLHSQPVFDRDGWYARLHHDAHRPFPDGLRRAIIAHNLPVLRRSRSSYLRQIDAAVRRGDVVAVNHRLAAMLASFFDVLFALNRRPHPGEKRLLQYVEAICPHRPDDLADRVMALFAPAPWSDAAPSLVAATSDLIADLKTLVAEDAALNSCCRSS